jgi:prophage antirepressor-like protein
VISEDGKPLFCANDVAVILGYSKPRNAISTHCRGALKRGTPTSSGDQEMLFIPESDVYRLIMRSKLPDAERFQDWVCEDILPSIRKTGGYIQTTEKDTPETIIDGQTGRSWITYLPLNNKILKPHRSPLLTNYITS